MPKTGKTRSTEEEVRQNRKPACLNKGEQQEKVKQVKTKMGSTEPLIVEARLVAYALLGTRKALENASTTSEANGHRLRQREYQELLQRFETEDEHL